MYYNFDVFFYVQNKFVVSQVINQKLGHFPLKKKSVCFPLTNQIEVVFQLQTKLRLRQRSCKD